MNPDSREFRIAVRNWLDAEGRELAAALMVAMATAEIERERVDAYILPIFNQFKFPVRESWRGRIFAGEMVTKPSDLYLCDDKELCARYHVACDIAHREHGFVADEPGQCPALCAEHELNLAEWAILQSSAKALGAKFDRLHGEKRKEFLKIILGLASAELSAVA